MVGADEGEIEASLEAAVAAGRAAGAKGTFMVSPAGREWLDAQYPEVFAGFRADPAATETYERFEKINRELLALFTDWQMVPSAGGERVPNDHSDADYDTGVIDRLGAQHERAERVLDGFAALEPRLGLYKERLDTAYDKALAGETNGSRASASTATTRSGSSSMRTSCGCSGGNARRRLECADRRGDRRSFESASVGARNRCAMTAVADRAVVLDGATVPSREVVGNKGRSIAWMLSLGLPVPPALVPADRGVPPLPRRRRRARSRDLGLGARRDRRARGKARPHLRRRRAAAARLGPLRRRGLDAGDDGHGPQPRDHRRGRGHAGALSGDVDFARQTHCRFIHQFGETVLKADLDEPGPDATRRRSARRSARTPGRRSRPTRTSSCAR